MHHDITRSMPIPMRSRAVSPEEAICTCCIEPEACFMVGHTEGWRGTGDTSFTGCWTHTQTHMHPHACTQSGAHTHALAHTSTHTQAHACTHMHTHTHIHSLTHTHISKHAHTSTHAQTQAHAHSCPPAHKYPYAPTQRHTHTTQWWWGNAVQNKKNTGCTSSGLESGQIQKIINSLKWIAGNGTCD